MRPARQRCRQGAAVRYKGSAASQVCSAPGVHPAVQRCARRRTSCSAAPPRRRRASRPAACGCPGGPPPTPPLTYWRECPAPGGMRDRESAAQPLCTLGVCLLTCMPSTYAPAALSSPSPPRQGPRAVGLPVAAHRVHRQRRPGPPPLLRHPDVAHRGGGGGGAVRPGGGWRAGAAEEASACFTAAPRPLTWLVGRHVVVRSVRPSRTVCPRCLLTCCHAAVHAMPQAVAAVCLQHRHRRRSGLLLLGRLHCFGARGRHLQFVRACFVEQPQGRVRRQRSQGYCGPSGPYNPVLLPLAFNSSLPSPNHLTCAGHQAERHQHPVGSGGGGGQLAGHGGGAQGERGCVGGLG